MTDAEIIKDWEKILSTGDAPIGEHWFVTTKLAKETFDMLKSQKTEIDILIRKKETLQDEIAEQQAEIERLKRQENTVAKLYHKKGVKDFAKFLIDKAKGGIIHSFDIPDYVAEMEGESNG